MERIAAAATNDWSSPTFTGDLLMAQQQKQQQSPPPIFNLEPGGMIGISTKQMPVTAGFPKVFLFFAGILAGLAIGIAGALLAADRQISEAKDNAKLEQLQRQQLQNKIQKFCRENAR